MTRSRSRDALLLLGAVLVCFLPAITGAAFRPDEWYFRELQKPSWQPPPWVFGPVWTTLYLLMGVSLWRIARRAPLTAVFPALLVFGAQLFLNGLWSPVFFGLRRPGLAFAVIVMLWIAIVATMRAFRAHDRLAATLLFPYLAWVSFASVLNFTIWRLNP
jgi:tryptophan-rich sensory protein